MIQVADIVVRLRADASGVTAGVSQAKSSLEGFGAAAKSAGTEIAAFGAAITGAITAPIVAIGALGIEFNALKERATIAFTGILGSGEQARAFLAELAQFAAVTPFEFPDLVKAAQRLTAVGIEAKAVIPIMTALGDAVAAFGGSSAEIERVTVQLTQMLGKGKVSMQDMRVIAESIPSAMKTMADKLGISMEEMFSKMEKGSLKASDGVRAMLTGLLEKYHGQMEAQSRTFSGLISTLKDNARFAAADITANFFEKLKDGLVVLVDLIPKLSKAFLALPDVIKNTVAAVVLLAAAIGPVLLAVGGVIAILGGPFTLALVAVGTAIVALTAIVAMNFDRILQIFGTSSVNWKIYGLAFAETLGNLADAFAVVSRVIVMFFDGAISATKAGFEILKGLYRAFAEGAKDVLTGVFTLDTTKIGVGLAKMQTELVGGMVKAGSAIGEFAQRAGKDISALAENVDGKFARSFKSAFAQGAAAVTDFKRDWKQSMDDIEAALKKMNEAGGKSAGAGKEAAAALKKALQAHATDIQEFMDATGQKVKITADRLKALPAEISVPLLKVAELFKDLKRSIEDINFERAVKGLPQLDDTLKIVGKSIQGEFNTIKAIPADIIKAFEKLGFSFKEIFPAMERVVIDTSLAIKGTAEASAVGAEAMERFGAATEKALREAEDALPSFTTALEKMGKDVDFWVGESVQAFEAGKANIIESVLRQGESIAESLGKTGADIKKFGEQWASGILDNLVRAGKITQQEVDKMIEIHRKAAIKLPGIWEEVLGKIGSRTKGILSGVFDVIDTMPGKWGDAIRKTKSEIESWVSFIDSAVKLIQRLLGDDSPSGLGGILSGLSGMFGKVTQAAKQATGGAAGFGAEWAAKLGVGGKGGIGGALGGFLGGPIPGLIGLGVSLLGPLLGGLFKSGHQKRMEAMQEEEKRLQIEGLKEDLKKAMQETVQAALQTMQDALKLFDELPGFASIPNTLIKQFFKNLEKVLTMFADLAGKFNSDLLKKVKEFAEAIGPAIQVIAEGVGAFDQLAGFVGVSELSIQDFASALDRMLNALAEVRDGLEKRIIKLARRLAEKVMEAIGVIKDGVEAFQGLMDFKDVPAETMAAFGAALEAAVTMFMEISQRIDFFLLKQSAKMAERMQSIVSVLGAGVETLKGILEFQSVPYEVLSSFAANLEQAIKIFIEMSGRIDSELVQRAATIADRMSSILNSLKSIPEVFGLLRDYKPVGSNAISAIMQDFDAVATMVEFLLERAMKLKGNAEAFAEAVAGIREALASVFGSSFLGGGGGGGGGAYMPGAAHGSTDPYFTRSPIDTSPDPGSRTVLSATGQTDSSIRIGQIIIGDPGSLGQQARDFVDNLVQRAPRAGIAAVKA